jgi:bifunctional DNase/RNase
MPTATDRDFLDMPVSDIRRITHSGRDHHVVLLQEPQSGRRLPIFIGCETATEIALRLLGHGPQLARPLGSDLTARLVHALGGNVREVRIDRLLQGTYYAIIMVDGPQGIAEVAARPSDALALALVVEAARPGRPRRRRDDRVGRDRGRSAGGHRQPGGRRCSSPPR